MNVQSSQIRELMLYDFELSYDAAEATKSIFCTKGESSVDQNATNGWFKKFRSSF